MKDLCVGVFGESPCVHECHLCVVLSIFTHFTMLSIVYAIILFFCVSSVSSQYCIKKAKHMVMQTMLHDGTGTVVFFCQRSLQNSYRVTPNRSTKYMRQPEIQRLIVPSPSYG